MFIVIDNSMMFNCCILGCGGEMRLRPHLELDNALKDIVVRLGADR